MTVTPRLSRLTRAALGWLILVALCLAIYWPALRGGLIWDDDAHITTTALRSWDGLRRIWCELGATQQYYPLLHSAFWVEHRLWGDQVLGYHLLNVVLHASCAGLLVLVVRRLALPGAWIAGLLFALHPVHVESVAWITEQKNTLSLLLYLLAALAYLRFERGRSAAFYWLATGLFVLMLLTKSVTATLPAALLVVFWWQRGRLLWRRDILPLVPWFVLAAGSGLFTAWVEHHLIGASGEAFALSATQRILLAGRVVWFYVGKLLWPAELIFSYPRWTIEVTDPVAWAYPAAVLATLALGWWRRTCLRGLLAGMLIFGGSLLPVLGFFNVYPFKYSFVADHFQYLASLGLIVPIAAGLGAFRGRLNDAPRRHALDLLAVAVLSLLGFLSFSQARIYRDADTLYRATLAANPSSFMAHNNLATLLAATGRTDEALRHLEESRRINPRNFQTQLNLGVLLMHLPGRRDEALTRFEDALLLKPGDPQANNNCGFMLADMPGRLPDAIACYERALAARPDYVQARINLGAALLRTPDRLLDAITEFETATRLQPSNADAHYNLGVALMKRPDRLLDAAHCFENAIRLNPRDADAHYKLGETLLYSGRKSDARPHFAEAQRLRFEAGGR